MRIRLAVGLLLLLTCACQKTSPTLSTLCADNVVVEINRESGEITRKESHSERGSDFVCIHSILIDPNAFLFSEAIDYSPESRQLVFLTEKISMGNDDLSVTAYRMNIDTLEIVKENVNFDSLFAGVASIKLVGDKLYVCPRVTHPGPEGPQYDENRANKTIFVFSYPDYRLLKKIPVPGQTDGAMKYLQKEHQLIVEIPSYGVIVINTRS